MSLCRTSRLLLSSRRGITPLRSFSYGRTISQPKAVTFLHKPHWRATERRTFSSESKNDVHHKNFVPIDEAFDDPRQSLLQAALKEVPTYGWTIESIAVAAESMGYPGVAHGMFPEGPIELVDYFIDKCNRDLVAKIPEMNLDKLNPIQRIELLLRTRLEMVAPYANNYSQAMALAALPQNLPRSLEHMGILVDEIWYQAGDRSTDINWYAKRGALAAIYTSTELTMLTDLSKGHRETWNFLHRRVEDLQHFHNFRLDTQHVLGIFGRGVAGVVEGMGSLGSLGEALQRNAGTVSQAVSQTMKQVEGLTKQASQGSQGAHTPPEKPSSPGQ